MLRFLTLMGGVAVSVSSCAGPDGSHVGSVTNGCRTCFHGMPLALTTIPGTEPELRRLDKDLDFTDKAGLVWKASVGDITDGASIPDVFLPITGSRFEPDFLPAAVVHDHYTDRVHDHLVRTWQSAARVFYEAMRANGTPAWKAKLMYYAVYVFGPHWGKLSPGTYCGPNCVNLTLEQSVALRAQDHIDASEDQPVSYFYQPQLATKADLAELLEVRAQIVAGEARSQPLTESDLEREAAQRHPANPFLNARASSH